MNAFVRVLRPFHLHVAIANSLFWLAIQPAHAGLPGIEPPSSGSGGGLMKTIKGYFQDGIVLFGLVAAAVAFLIVANAAIQTFAEVRDGKATWAWKGEKDLCL